MKSIEDLLQHHPFFQDLNPEYIHLIAGCGVNQVFQPGEILANEGSDADRFFIVREGTVAIQLHSPSKGGITAQTVGKGEVIGWSWLFPPYKWAFDIKALETTKIISLNGRCLREKCEADHHLGFALMKKFSYIMTRRLEAARMQFLDLYKGD